MSYYIIHSKRIIRQKKINKMGAKVHKEPNSDPTKLTDADINILLKRTYYTRKNLEKWHQDFIVR